MKKSQKSLANWTRQDWRTKSGKPSAKTGERYLPAAAIKSGKPSAKTGERYLPAAAIKSLTSSEYAATTKAKREGKAAGKQFVKQPKSIAKKTAKFRRGA
jgi:hypothetical protein